MISTDPPKQVRLKTCPHCGSTWFREAECRLRGIDEAPRGRLPMPLLICLCGTVVAPNIGGMVGGPTATTEILALLDSLQAASAVSWDLARLEQTVAGAQSELINLSELEEIDKQARKLERKAARLKADRDPKRTSRRGRTWQPPQRQPATKGRDVLVHAIQDSGFTFAESRKAVHAVFEVITEALTAGHSVTTPVGTFHIKEGPKAQRRRRFGRFQTIHKLPKKILFEPAPSTDANVEAAENDNA